MTNTDQNIRKEPEMEVDSVTNVPLIKDHEYDGIRELDNDMPSWWVWLFIITIVFSLVYLVRLWVFRADDLIQEKEFQKEMAAAPKVNRPVEELAMAVLDDELSISNGMETWNKICSVCHLADGGGLVGPNMTDNYWIHGNRVEDLFDVITNGVIEKGMIPYKDQLSPRQRLEVISFIMLRLQGTTPANPKAPEGVLYE
ncbi:MAG TPA: cbb3-type cytochrome c oxidase N-terminal domain-containing protein [Bacteroidales bacterium]|nr:cbb3-type cytochrome c oxidase N-terminal domain-containing protein [Bacteroidales bacterium]